MLVNFRCENVPTVTMFGEHAKPLLKLMGLSGEVPGGLVAADIPAALSALRNALSAGGGSVDAPAPGEDKRGDNDDSGAGGVSLAARAHPLEDFLQRAVAAKSDITWTA